MVVTGRMSMPSASNGLSKEVEEEEDEDEDEVKRRVLVVVMVVVDGGWLGWWRRKAWVEEGTRRRRRARERSIFVPGLWLGVRRVRGLDGGVNVWEWECSSVGRKKKPLSSSPRRVTRQAHP